MVLPRILYQGELTTTENEKGILKDLLASESFQNENKKFCSADDPFEIFHRFRFSCDLLSNNFPKSQENFNKFFKIKLKGYFFPELIKVSIIFNVFFQFNLLIGIS